MQPNKKDCSRELVIEDQFLEYGCVSFGWNL